MSGSHQQSSGESKKADPSSATRLRLAGFALLAVLLVSLALAQYERQEPETWSAIEDVGLCVTRETENVSVVDNRAVAEKRCTSVIWVERGFLGVPEGRVAGCADPDGDLKKCEKACDDGDGLGAGGCNAGCLAAYWVDVIFCD